MTQDNVIPFPKQQQAAPEPATGHLVWEDPAAAEVYWERVAAGKSVERLPEPRMLVKDGP